jgi:hypothetical protein
LELKAAIELLRAEVSFIRKEREDYKFNINRTQSQRTITEDEEQDLII